MAEIAAAEFKDEEVRKFISDILKQSDWVFSKRRQYINTISGVVFQDIMEHFEKEEGPNGKWKVWSPKYQTIMAKKGKGGNLILQDTGKLRQSFKPSAYRKAKDGIIWYNPAQTKSGFPYAYAHDNDEEERRQLPRRSFMWLSDKAMDNIAIVTLDFIMEK